MKKILLLNAPPSSGKDTVAKRLVDKHGFTHMKFAKHIKDRTHALYGLNKATDAYENLKDISSKDFLGLTPRQAYIEVSERYMKPMHGKNIWSDYLCNDINNSDVDYIVISDLGFQEEWEYMLMRFTNKIAHAIIHRPQCNFENDTRGFIKIHPPFKTVKMNEHSKFCYSKYIIHNSFDIDNSLCIDYLHNQVDMIANKLISRTIDINKDAIGLALNNKIG